MDASLWISGAAVVVGPVAAYLGAAKGASVTKTAAAQLDKWRQREETMRLMRWAADKVTDDHSVGTEVGIGALDALLVSGLLQEEDAGFVQAVTDAVTGGIMDEAADDDVVIGYEVETGEEVP